MTRNYSVITTSKEVIIVYLGSQPCFSQVALKFTQNAQVKVCVINLVANWGDLASSMDLECWISATWQSADPLSSVQHHGFGSHRPL